MTPAERMRKYRARKHLRAAWERAIRAGVDPCEVMGVTPIGVTERFKHDLSDFMAHAGVSVEQAAAILGRPS